MHKTYRILIYCVLAISLWVTGWYSHFWYQHQNNACTQRHVRLSGYRFISPLLDVELPEGYSVSSEPIPFKNKIKSFIDTQLKTGKISNISVYFRDLSDGPWFGINDTIKYNPASMMKVPVMIAWLKRAEQNPAELAHTITFHEQQYPGGPQTIKPAQTLVDGVAYQVETLLHYMVNFSDNKSMWLLYKQLNPDELNAVLASMDIVNTPDGVTNLTTVHGYSGFFRILYNAAYLNREMSEKALEILSHQNFPQGVEAGLPNGVVFCGKFGEYNLEGSHDNKQIHEFGIVYHPQGPYILGIMTSGNDSAAQLAAIKQISNIIYTAVAQQISTTQHK